MRKEQETYIEEPVKEEVWVLLSIFYSRWLMHPPTMQELLDMYFPNGMAYCELLKMK